MIFKNKKFKTAMATLAILTIFGGTVSSAYAAELTNSQSISVNESVQRVELKTTLKHDTEDKDSSANSYLKEISSHEALVKLDDNPVKVVLPTDNLTFIKNMDNMDLAQALVVADYIAKEQYDGHYTLFGFSTGYRFCFGTLDKVSYHTTNLMPLVKL